MCINEFLQAENDVIIYSSINYGETSLSVLLWPHLECLHSWKCVCFLEDAEEMKPRKLGHRMGIGIGGDALMAEMKAKRASRLPAASKVCKIVYVGIIMLMAFS